MATLAGVLPELAIAFGQLQAYGATKGIAIGIADFGGVRTLADTTQILQYRVDDYNAAVARGDVNPATTTMNQFRPIAQFGSSYHNYGAAFDVMIQARPANMTVAQALATLGAAASSYGLKWGGAFVTSPKDPPHFELAQSLDAVKQKYALMTGSVVPGGSSYDLGTDDSGSWDDGIYDDAGNLLDSHTSLALASVVVVAVVWWAWQRRRS